MSVRLLAAAEAMRRAAAAIEDLKDILLGMRSRWSGVLADTCLDQIDAALNLPGNHPRRGSDFDHVRPGMRSLLVGRHAVFNRTNDCQIRIVRILRQSKESDAHPTNC